MTHAPLRRVAFFTPYLQAGRGNATTAARLISALSRAGYEVETFAFEEESSERGLALLQSADIVHGLHFRRFFQWLEQTKAKVEQPLVLTSGGTDVHIDLQDEAKVNELAASMNTIDALVLFTEEAKHKAAEQFPSLADRLYVIPQGVEPPPVLPPAKLPTGDAKFLLPAGLRAVKDIFYLFEAFERLNEHFDSLQVVCIGEAIETKVTQSVHECAEIYSWFHYVEPVPKGEMGAYYMWADAVLNTSTSEGQPMALLEAMALGKLLFARRNAGNESVINDGVNGFLFHHPLEFEKKWHDIAADPVLLQKICSQAANDADQKHRPEQEAQAYMRIYEKLWRKS
ncbi:glycosyl transferase family 1 [Salsuginibacillus halophilus]|uniref:Glycosyl transferase family 1 n=1 Tax=Salsuginibacillus halophilus TaxID=517424 RepID=A0A2P8HYM9_9BACI|nr:glycosyltransferase family 4 protein [Salsuginibacillus halophilus]PSL51317.1 glycosyl transferase family 1 [Salsuginibacillus halophilus]